MEEQSTFDSEFAHMPKIMDKHTRYVLSMDEFWRDNIQGTKLKNW